MRIIAGKYKSKLIPYNKKINARPTTDIAKEPVGTSNANFQMYFRAENMKLIEGDYDVSVSRNKISTFRHNTKAIQYWVSLEQDSKYED